MATHLLINPWNLFYVRIPDVYIFPIGALSQKYKRIWCFISEEMDAIAGGAGGEKLSEFRTFLLFICSGKGKKEKMFFFFSNVHQKNVWTTYERQNTTFGTRHWHFQKNSGGSSILILCQLLQSSSIALFNQSVGYFSFTFCRQNWQCQNWEQACCRKSSLIEI